MKLHRRDFLKLGGAAFAPAAAAARPKPPNIVLILADDIGYGDFACYGATRVKTPNVDRLAREGIRFTDAHAPASVCTPTRYGLLTGQYPWRNRAGDHILNGDSPLSIDPSTVTLPGLLERRGYSTGLVGKWHLGLGTTAQDWNGELKPGPLEVGFDSAFFYAATNDRVPCVYIENHRVVGLDPADPLHISYKAKVGNEPTGRDHPEMLKLPLLQGHDATIVNGSSRIGYTAGGKSAWWKDEDMADTFTRKAVSFIEQHRQGPFFLYFATHGIHQPRWPHPRFRGSSGCGTRCDAIREFDASVGEVLAALDRLKIAGDTLVVVTSDNGGAMDDGYLSHDVRDANGHLCNGRLRGFKGSLFEGGHREPFLARWPGRIQPGSESGELLCLVDVLATCAAITGRPLPPGAGPDSFDMLPALLGKRRQPLRDHLVMQNNGPEPLAIRRGPWKLILPRRAGAAPPQLYNLDDDLEEKNDLAATRPETVRALSALLARVRESGRSRP